MILRITKNLIILLSKNFRILYKDLPPKESARNIKFSLFLVRVMIVK